MHVREYDATQGAVTRQRIRLHLKVSQTGHRLRFDVDVEAQQSRENCSKAVQIPFMASIRQVPSCTTKLTLEIDFQSLSCIGCRFEQLGSTFGWQRYTNLRISSCRNILVL